MYEWADLYTDWVYEPDYWLDYEEDTYGATYDPENGWSNEEWNDYE